MDRQTERILAERTPWIILAIGGAVGLVIGIPLIIQGIITLVVSIAKLLVSIASQISATWILASLQDAIVFLVSAGIIFVPCYYFARSLNSISKRIDQLTANQKKILRKLATMPWPIISATLLSQAYLVVADKAFGDDVMTIIAINIVLLVFFYVSNELLLSVSTLLKILGVIIWFVTVAIVPGVLMLNKHWSLDDLWSRISAFPPGSLITIIIALLLMVLFPLIFAKSRSSILA